MDKQQGAKRTCPACSSEKYLFRGRKKIPAEPGTEGEIMETKYRCTACEHVWKERATVQKVKKRVDADACAGPDDAKSRGSTVGNNTQSKVEE